MYGYTAAHKTMKFGTRLRVTNPDTNQHVDVIVNDRGPFIPGRDLDLSFGAARAIGFDNKGVGRVKIEFLGRDMRYAKRIAFTPSKALVRGGVTIQVGSFANELYADRLKEGLEINYKAVYTTAVSLNGIQYYRVRIGKFDTYESAYSFAEKLAEEGYNTFITSID
jgi:rare lipoprotein A